MRKSSNIMTPFAFMRLVSKNGLDTQKGDGRKIVDAYAHVVSELSTVEHQRDGIANKMRDIAIKILKETD